MGPFLELGKTADKASFQKEFENPFGNYASVQEAYDDSLFDGFGGRDVTVLFCSQAGLNVPDVAQHIDLDPANIHAVRAPVAGGLPGVREDVTATLQQADLLFGHQDCGGAKLLEGEGHPDTRATKVLRTLAHNLGGDFAGTLPFRATTNNVLYVVSKDVADFDPTRVPELPTGYTLHEHIGGDNSLQTNTTALLGVIKDHFPTAKIHVVPVTNGRKGANREFADKLRTITGGSRDVRISPLVVKNK